MVVLGKKEASEKKIAVRHRQEGDLGQMDFENFLKRLEGETDPLRS